MSRQVFAELLGFHRSTKGLSQEQLAEASDTDPDTIGKLERGQRRPRPSTAKLLAGALKLSAEDERDFMAAASGRPAPSDPYAPGAPLPSELTTFVGREQEVEAMRRLLGEHRLVTLTGPGGVGKSRLALHVARDEVEAKSESVWQVDLGATDDPQLVVPAIAEALGV